MSALASLQHALLQHVLRPSAPEAAAARGAVVHGEEADGGQRLGVYTHAYRARLLEVLGNDFPGLRTLAGDAFEPLALDYIEATRSPYYNVRWYGAGLADHLRSRAPWTEQPAFAEMAALEWAMGLAFDAADAAVAGVADVADVAPEDWPRLRLRLHPSLQRLRLRWNLNAIRNAVDADGGPIPALQKLDQVQPWVVWRKDLGVRYRRLEADEAAALDAAALGATFPEMCLLLCDWHPPETVAQRAATLLRTWVEDDWVSALEFSDG